MGKFYHGPYLLGGSVLQSCIIHAGSQRRTVIDNIVFTFRITGTYRYPHQSSRHIKYLYQRISAICFKCNGGGTVKWVWRIGDQFIPEYQTVVSQWYRRMFRSVAGTDNFYRAWYPHRWDPHKTSPAKRWHKPI